jgi:hypothetical protein
MTLPTTQEIAATYNPPGYEDAWNSVEDYRRVLEYASHNPDKGSQAVSTAVDLPRGRIRPWLDGSRPDVVHGIQTAESHHWTADTATSKTTLGIVQLAAWLLSAGSLRVDDTARIRFTLTPDTRDQFDEVAANVGVDYDVIRDDDSPDSNQRATEATITTDSSVLGRVLLAMDLPTGTKSTDGPRRLPSFVDDLDDDLKSAFVETYLRNRGTPSETSDVMTIQEERPDSYLRDLAEIFRDVSGESVTATDIRVTLSADATRAILAD